jgi:diadenosine tetraphosphate (Ap4A) HIT family hydrolase
MNTSECIFCKWRETDGDFVLATEKWIVKSDLNPVNEGHSLIIPKKHHVDPFDLSLEEWNDLQVAMYETKNKLDKTHTPDGYNIGINCGGAAGQTVFHLHIHIIPRYRGDVESPRGGIRNFKKSLKEYR